MTDLNPLTGLPQLPDGYRFSVVRRRVLGYGVYYTEGYNVLLQKHKKGLLGGKWVTLYTGTVYEPDKDGKFGPVSTELSDTNIRRAAEGLVERMREDNRLRSLEKKYLGSYPPKSL
jgi:hypothetical protein